MSWNASTRQRAALAAAFAAAWLGLATAHADDHGRPGGRGDDRRSAQPAEPRGSRDRPDRDEERRFERQRPDGWSGQPPSQEPPRWQGPGEERTERRWNPRAARLRPGDQLPPQYRQRQFVVSDWRAHRLYAPPPGHQWLQPEPGNYILIGRHGEIVNMLVGQ